MTDLIKAFQRLGLGLSDTQKSKRKHDDEEAGKREMSRREAIWATGDGLQEIQPNAREKKEVELVSPGSPRSPPPTPPDHERSHRSKDKVSPACSSKWGRGGYASDNQPDTFGWEEHSDEDYYSS